MSHVGRSCTIASLAALVLLAFVIPGAAADHRDPRGSEFYDEQWNLQAIHAEAAWDGGQFGSADVTVAVLDTGIDTGHPDLEGLVDLERSKSYIEDSAACPPGEPGTPSRSGEDGEDALADSLGLPVITDFHSHGTAVAGLVSSNAVHLAGVTAHTTLLAVKVHDLNRRNCLKVYLDAVRYAADNRADVIHMSFPLEFTEAQFPNTFKDLQKRVNDTMTYAHTRGAILVAAAGNAAQEVDPNSGVFRFCNAKHVVCVSATDAADVRAAYTNFGPAIDIAGPGGTSATPVWLVCSTETRASGNPAGCQIDGQMTWTSTGTSFGAAATSGLLALLVDRIGINRPDDVIEALRASAEDLGDPGRDPYYGHGLINVENALQVPVP